MGASGWSHRVPYQTDVQAALDALRADVFARGEFEKMWEQFPDMVDDLAAELDELIAGRWEGIFAIGYTDDAPSTIVFAGVSGDE